MPPEDSGGDVVKITDLSVIMVNWASGPWATATASFGGTRQLGVLTISTDEGVEGHAFLGSSRQGADAYVGPMMEFIKPAIMGRNPLDIGSINPRSWGAIRWISAPSGPVCGRTTATCPPTPSAR
jgi:hypothetical protein